MAVKFAKKYGLDPDRKKLEAGEKLTILKVASIHASKKLGNDGKSYEIASFDALDEKGAPVKRYDSASVIVAACKDMLQDARPDGTLKEPVEVEVVEQISDKGRKYNAFI